MEIRKTNDTLARAVAWAFAISVIFLILYVVVSIGFNALVGGNLNCDSSTVGPASQLTNSMCSFKSTVLSLLAIPTFLFILVGGVLFFLLQITILSEIGLSKNELSWKLIWFLAVGVVPAIGVLAYWFIARKDLR